MIDFRKRHPAIHRSRFFDGKVNERGLPDVSWHGCQLLRPGWDDPERPRPGIHLGRLRSRRPISTSS